MPRKKIDQRPFLELTLNSRCYVFRLTQDVFGECFSGYVLVRKGLILQAVVLLRSAFEVTTQALMFMEREDMAEAWLQGKRIKPSRVRELTSMPASERELYEKLANLAHPNYQAFKYFSIPVPRKTGLAKAYAYGGWFAPREAGQIAIQLLWAQLVFLERFYMTYSADLEKHGLLWREEAVEEAFGGNANPDYTWEQFLGSWRKALTRLTEDHAKLMPLDIVEAALTLSDYGPDEKQQWREGFERASQEQSEAESGP